MAGPEATRLGYAVSRPWFLGLLPPSHPPSSPRPRASPKRLGSRHDGGREASFTAAVAEAATTVAICCSSLSTPEGWRGSGDLGVPCLFWLAYLPADLEWC